jgi:hypothetical protein
MIKSIADIQSRIDEQIAESQTLEYKSALSGTQNNRELAKEVSGFANSQGGILIYGIQTRGTLPESISWIEDANFEDHVANVIGSTITPKLIGWSIDRIEKFSSPTQAVYVIEVARSADGPHRANNSYYKRDGATTRHMDHDELKSALFGVGRAEALRLEITRNRELASQTLKLLDTYWHNPEPSARPPIAFISLHTSAWDALVASGMLFAYPNETVTTLSSLYASIKEFNTICEANHLAQVAYAISPTNLPVMVTPALDSTFIRGVQHGTYWPAVIRDMMTRLAGLLEKARIALGIDGV